MSAWWVVLRKELLDAFRDRRMVVVALVVMPLAVPLILAMGAGAESRRTLGATVFFGVTISVFLTLYLIPAMYVLLARSTKSPEYVSRLIDRLKRDEPVAARPATEG